MNRARNLHYLKCLLKSTKSVRMRHSIPVSLCRRMSNLQTAMSNAEQLVGCPTTLDATLKRVVDEEPASLYGLAKKLVGSGHPLLGMARDLLAQDAYNTRQLANLWVLLVSSAVDKSSSVGPLQRSLVEAAEMINTAILTHRSIADRDQYKGLIKEKMLGFGNKLSVLGGDYLMAKASRELAKLGDTLVVDYMSRAIADMAEASVYEAAQEDMTTWTLADWEHYVYLSRGSLTANCSKAAVSLTGCRPETHEIVASLAHYLELALSVCKDVRHFQDESIACLHPYNFVIWLAMNNTNDRPDRHSDCYQGFLNDPNDSSKSSRLRKEVALHLCPDYDRQASAICDGYVAQCRQLLLELDANSVTFNALDRIVSNIKVGA